jgi:hypothetical protein
MNGRIVKGVIAMVTTCVVISAQAAPSVPPGFVTTNIRERPT